MIYLDKKKKVPLYEQLYVCIKDEILSGSLPALTRLPATRQLAADLHVSRNTVDAAYQQLVIEGYLSARMGSGYTVNELSKPMYCDIKPEYFQTSTQSAQEPDIRYDFWFPLIRASIFPTKEWKKTLSDAMCRLDSRSCIIYPNRNGIYELRQQLAEYLYYSRGVRCQPDQIIISAGTQFNIELLLKLFDPHTCVIGMEDPGYYGIKDIFTVNHFQMVPIPVKKDGLDLDTLHKTEAKLLYITPSHQFPTGTVLPIRKRLDILEWAHKTHAFIIEDDYDSELRYLSMPIPSLQSLDKYDCVIYQGTFSKSLSASLRVSYMVLPRQLCDIYQKTCGMYLSPVSLLHQYALAEFIRQGYFDRHLNRLRNVFSKKHDAFLTAVKQVFGSKIKLGATDAGVHVLADIDTTLTQDELVQRALVQHVRVYATAPYYMDTSSIPPHQLLLGYGGIETVDYVDALSLLYQAWFGE